jgi:NitT/TauT family transport system substrate-binding protein
MLITGKAIGRGVAAVAAATALTVFLSGCIQDGSAGAPAEAGADGNVTLRLALNNTVASLPAVVADEEGFFEAEGITVETTTLADITKIPPTLGKQYEIGFGVQPTLIRAASQGVDIAMISGNAITSSEKPEYVIMARPDAGITGPEDFEGKTLGAPTLAGNVHIGTLYWLQENGVDLENVNDIQVPTPTMVDQLKQGLIDAAEMQQPYTDIAKEAGMVEVGYALGAVADPTTMSSWQANRTWAEENPDTIAGFRAALDEAMKWIIDNDAAARDILAEFTGIDRETIEGMPLQDFTTEASTEAVEQWDAPMRAVAGFTADIDYSKLVVD